VTRAPGSQSSADKPSTRGETAASPVKETSPAVPLTNAANAVLGQTSSSPRVSSPPEPPPPPIDDLYEVVPELPTQKTALRANSDNRIDRIKAALEAKRKMMIVSTLDKGNITIDDDYFRVEYALENAKCKAEIESRDKRIAVEDACEQVLGRRLTLRASIAGQFESESKPIRKESVKAPSADDPKLRALVDKFHGEVIEVIKPEQ
jgi:hypothetical protein